MGLLYLIRHPLTVPDPARPPSEWGLAAQGEAQVAELIQAAFWREVSAVYTSTHGKTVVVGEAAQQAYDLPVVALAGLDEASREVWVDPDEFLTVQTRFLSEPDRAPVPGWQPANEALTRFGRAMADVLTRHPIEQSLVVVSHATVLTLYLAALYGQPPTLESWQSVGFASVCAIDRATLQPLTPFLAAPYRGLPLPDQEH